MQAMVRELGQDIERLSEILEVKLVLILHNPVRIDSTVLLEHAVILEVFLSKALVFFISKECLS
jgi:hypothetical protein